MIVLTYTLHLREPVLVTRPGGDPNTDESEAFIPGSAIRGALAGRYLAKYGQSAANDPPFTQLFLDGSVRFLNAYYVVPGADDRALPTPRSWVGQKDDAGREINDRRVWKIYDRSQGQRPDQEAGLGRFIQWTGGTVIISEPLYEVAVHNARNRKMGRAVERNPDNSDERDPDSALFRYRALAAGQTFRGVILVDDAGDADELSALLKGTLLLGGSHSAGYGLTEIKLNPNPPNDWREVPATAPAIKTGDPVMFYLLSDTILRDENGQPTTDLSACLPDEWKDCLDLERQFTRLTWVGGFNAKWGLPLPQTWAVERGSVWVFRAKEDISETTIKDLERNGLGARRAEGFGRVAINPPWHGKDNLWWHKPAAATNLSLHETAEAPEKLHKRENGEEPKLLDQMNERLARQELDRLVVAAAQQVESTGRLSKSQLARLRLRVQRITAEKGFTDFAKYLEDTKTRKSANDQFRRFYVIPPQHSQRGSDRENFREWLGKLAQFPTLVWDAILPSSDWQPPQIGDEPFDYREEKWTRHYAVRLIDAVCEQLAKKGRDD